MKKLTALILSLITVLSCGVYSFAADVNSDSNREYVIVDNGEYLSVDSSSVEEEQSEEVTEVPEAENAETETEETEEEPNEEPNEEPFSGEIIMYYCSCMRNVVGHSWLYFENNTNKAIKVGYVTLQPGGTTSVGSLRNGRYDKGGTYYNAEAYMARGRSVVKNSTISLKETLTLDELAKVSEKIKSRNSYNLIFNNCGNFAAAVWNTVSKKKLFNVVTPLFTIFAQALYGGKIGAVDMKTPDISGCYKQRGNGVVQADVRSFTQSCVG